MKIRLDTLWEKGSRIGLRDDETLVDLREVVFLNRVLLIFPLIMICYIPLEIFFNGFSMMHVVGLMTVMFLLPLLFHYFRLFRIAHYYIFLVGNILITNAGLMVGKGINNHVSLIPIVLLGIILFKTKAERVAALFVAAGFFVFQQYYFDRIQPSIVISDQTRSVFSFIFFLLALVLTFLLGYYFIGINREYEKIIMQQKDAIALKNKEITDSINYAKRIQSAILPSQQVIQQLLKESFILYQPKDIVAGDFYWIEQKEDLVLFAAADSTGHGVPGAMVSVVCNNALNRCVREFGLTKPSDILAKAREIIIAEFEKSEEDVRDGMDISLCALNLTNMKLEWSGANNPLLIIRDKSIIEYKPDKQPVGKFTTTHPFTNHSVKLIKGDFIYIFSDGFADQFGGPQGKKYKYKSFKQLLLDIHDKEIAQQQDQLSQTLMRWKGTLEQVDDICIIGVKV